MATLGTAYVQIVPSAKGIDANMKKIMDPASATAGENSGKTVGNHLVSSFSKILVASGIGAAIGASFTQGAKLQQSLGGVETIFKDSADKMKDYAAKAFKTAGLSANEYMEQATSFSSSLIQSLQGDTEKAADYANMAMIDMSDNANKFGTDISHIQDAYQGFAKQNFTMLDNLKLGYGGTKTEMERLINDANKVKVANGEMADLSIDSFADMVEAVHIIQEKIDITGTTAQEAATTVSGSFNMMKSAAKNFAGNLALGKDVEKSLYELADTIKIFVVNNLIPMTWNLVKGIVTIAPKLIFELRKAILEKAPVLIDTGLETLANFSKGLVQGIPNAIKEALVFTQQLGDMLASKAPEWIEKGFEMLNNFVDGVINAIPIMIERLPKIVSTFANIINDNAPTILKKGAELLVKLVKGIISAIPVLIKNIPAIIKAFVDTLMAYNWLSLGSKVIKFFTNGIKSMVGSVGSASKNVFDTIINNIRHLPSTLKEFAKKAIAKIPEVFKAGINSVKSSTGQIITAVLSYFKDLPGQVWNYIKSIPSKIANAFKFEIPHIKLPHLTMSGKFSLVPPRVPSFGVEWYAKGAQFNGPSVVGVGEAGTEYALPLNKKSLMPLAVNLNELTSKGDSSMIINLIVTIIDILQKLLNAGVYIDSDKLIGSILPKIDEELGGAY